MRFHTVELLERRTLGAYTLVSYRWDGPVEPGQFAMTRAAGPPLLLDPLLARPFSFYDHDGETASILFEVRGRGTALLDAATETIQVSAPLGRPFDVRPDTERAALLGGGVGVAPLKILSRRLDGLGIPHDTFLGFADDRTAEAASGFPGAAVATMDGSAGVHGTVLDAAGDLSRYDAVFAVGPNPMLAAVKAAVPPEANCQLSVEERMGCGNGSCNGCVVPVEGRGFVRSCVEGPVFRAEALAW